MTASFCAYVKRQKAMRMYFVPDLHLVRCFGHALTSRIQVIVHITFWLSMGLSCLKLCAWHLNQSCGGLLHIGGLQVHKESQIFKGCPVGSHLLYNLCVVYPECV